MSDNSNESGSSHLPELRESHRERSSKAINGHQHRGKGGQTSGSTRKQAESKQQYNATELNVTHSVAKKTILFMPSHVTPKQLRSVGMRSRTPDRFELCPAGYRVLEELPDVAIAACARPRGRGKRGRPRGSRKANSDRTSANKISVADTSHRRTASKRQPVSQQIAEKINQINTKVYPLTVTRRHLLRQADSACTQTMSQADPERHHGRSYRGNRKRVQSTSDESDLPSPFSPDSRKEGDDTKTNRGSRSHNKQKVISYNEEDAYSSCETDHSVSGGDTYISDDYH